MWISCLALLLYLPNLHGLYCYSSGVFHFSREVFLWDNFTTLFNQSSASTCHVRLTVDYQTRDVTVRFQPQEYHSPSNIEFGSTIQFLPNDIQRVVSYLDYRCSSGNLCDKEFLKIWPKLLLNSRDNALHRHLLSSWTNSTRCHEKLRTTDCESYLCFTIYNELKNLSYGRRRCEDRSSSNPVNIHIHTKSGNTDQEYQCRKNHCTGEISYDSLIPRNSTGDANDRNHLEELILKRALIIVGVLLIIGSTAYSIQCRNYRQGYRSTRYT